jgi:hypothetical protein
VTPSAFSSILTAFKKIRDQFLGDLDSILDFDAKVFVRN